MRMFDIIAKKRDKQILTKEEIDFMIDGYVNGEIPDYQMSALLMAIYLQGMSMVEISDMTKAMTASGDVVDLAPIEGVKVDKHSTGGVGDKTTLIVAPIVAACGVKAAKMSGRGLGHTGGTVDKLEAIPGFQTSLSREDFFRVVNEEGLSVIGQSGNLAPADKKLYALRDVTATIASIPLIAASIMSKKLAAGCDCIVLDVKCGSGAFMKTPEDAKELARVMVEIGKSAGKPTMALITNMDIPLGYHIGNALEIVEAVQVLQGNGPEDLRILCLELSAAMLHTAGVGTMEACRKKAQEAISTGEALNRLAAMVKAQGGDEQVIYHLETFPQAPVVREIKSQSRGYISHMDTEECGIASCLLGAGRQKKEDTIDYSAGIVLCKKTGDYVETGDVLARFYTASDGLIPDAEKRFRDAVTFSKTPVEKGAVVLAFVK